MATILQIRADARCLAFLFTVVLSLGISFAPAQPLRNVTFGEYFHRVEQVAFSPDGKTVACLCLTASPFIRLSDVKTGKETATLRGAVHPPLLVFTPDGKSLVTGAAELAGPFKKGERPARPWKFMAKVWDVRKGTVRLTIRFLTDEGDGGVMTPDGRTLIVTGVAAGLYDLQTGARIGELKAEAPRASLLALSRDGKWLATMHPGGITRPTQPGPVVRHPDRVFVWDLAARKKVCDIEVPVARADRVTALALSPDGKQVAIGARTEVSLYDRRTGKRVKVLDIGNLDGDEGGMTSPGFMSFTPNGNTLVIAGAGRGPAIALWDPGTDKVAGNFGLPRKETPFNRHTLGALSVDGSMLATAGPKLRLWDLPAPKDLKNKPLQKD